MSEMSDLDHYDYHLPPELIAQDGLSRRSDARLMVISRREQSITHAHVRDLGEFLAQGDCLVCNDTRVVPARLEGYRLRTGGRWSGLFVRAEAAGHWQVMSKTRGTLHVGECVMLRDRESRDAFSIEFLAKLADGMWGVAPRPPGNAFELLAKVGRVPLPPYIRGGRMRDADVQRYQTVFARRPGAIAAPTAGLHFTDDLLRRLADLGIGTCRLTLHVGVGTFRPIAVQRLDHHAMHREWGELTVEAARQLQACRDRNGRIVAVGTTCARVLETAAAAEAIRPWRGETDLFIRPPFTFRAMDALMTNFHLPRSTLLVLVRTFGGDDLIRRAYQVAVEERYRFYSYGDAMLIL